jgi:hypothetical protein
MNREQRRKSERDRLAENRRHYKAGLVPVKVPACDELKPGDVFTVRCLKFVHGLGFTD